MSLELLRGSDMETEPRRKVSVAEVGMSRKIVLILPTTSR